MERKIGEIFEYNGEWYQCINTGNCSECAFTGKRCYDFSTKGVDIIGDCTGRTFKKLEKVGEPYKFQKRTIQTYKLYTEPFISFDMDFINTYLNGSDTIDIIIKQNIEDMEEKKLNLKPFDIQKAREGKPVCTRDGRKARILCYDFKQNEEYPILVAVENKDGKECALLYSNDGISEMYKSSNNELAMLPEKKEGWVNVYRDCDGANITKDDNIYSSKEAAMASAQVIDRDNYVATTIINWEE